MKFVLAFVLMGAIACNLAAAEKSRSTTRSLNSIPALTEIIEAKLNAAGINNVNDLLAEGGSPQGREEIAARSGLPAAQILNFVNCADLFRIKGIAGPTAALLEAAGVNSAPELGKRDASTLLSKLQQVNDAKKGKLPTEKQLADWIEEAKTLPKVVTY